MKYFKDIFSELKNIRWPSRKQTWTFTIGVIVLSLAIAYYLGAFDWLFTQALRAIL